jgi:Tol biopolymer transport system component
VRRRVISIGSVLVAVIALAVVLYNATVVDRRPPSVARVALSASANGDATLAQTLTAIDIQFSEPVKQGSVESRFRIVPFVQGTMTWASDGTTAIFTPSEKLPTGTPFTVHVDPGFEDLAGNVATTGLDGWAFRTVGRPVVVKVDPADGLGGVPVDSSLSITFDRLMDTRSVESAIRIEPVTSFHSAWSGETLTLSFATPLLYGTTYTVSIEPTAAGTDGSLLEGPFTTRFTTAAASLQVTSTIPSGGVAGVSVRGPIAILFDGSIDPASVTGALQITPAVEGTTQVIDPPTDATPVTDASPSPSSGSMLVFQPSAALAAHTTYTITLRPVVSRPGAPSQVAAAKTWSFTTGQPTTSGQNQIAFLSARSGVRNVWLMNPDGSNPRQLTDELAPVAGFDVTADGSRFAWSAGGQVRTMQIDGTGEQTLTASGRFEYAPHFAPDGRSLIVGRRDASGTDLGYWLVPLDGGDGRQILPKDAPPLGSALLAGDGVSSGEGIPVWSGRAAFDPGGKQVLVTTGGGELWHVDLTASDAASGADDTGIVAFDGPVWSPAHARFLIIGKRATDARNGLFTITPDGVAIRRMDAEGSVAGSPDGSVAFLQQDSAGGTHITVARTLASTTRALTTATDLWDRWPGFSPDGKLVLFARVPAADDQISAGIWTADVTTGRLAALAPDGAFPRWLP